MTRGKAIWWVNHLFEIRKEEYFNKGIMEDAKEVEEAQHMAIEALQNEETLKTQLANCHKEILRLLDFNDITESPDDDIESQNDVIEVVRCKDCRHFKKIVERSDSGLCYRDLVASAWKENGYCSRGERREDDEA